MYDVRSSMHVARLIKVSLLLLALSFFPFHVMGKDSKEASESNRYYKGPQLFSTAPAEGKTVQSIDRFGPVGIGIELIPPSFVMRVKNVEEGSPAAQTGELQEGMIIDSINGQVLEDIDPRLILGTILAKAESTDGKIRLVVRGKKESETREVIVTIPVIGDYSETWPLDCRKSERIVRDMAAYLKRTKAPGMGLSALFLLSTGEDADLEVVREWMQERAAEDKNLKETKAYPWHAGYGGPALCEYYLRTGDESIMHSIQLLVDRMEATMYNDAWGHRGIGSYSYMAGGHMNAAGVHVLTFMLLAKECGAEVNEELLLKGLRHFYRFAGHGNVAYGDGYPEPGYVDNGKTGGLAFAMKAAAALTPDGEHSIYQKASDISALKSFYSTTWMLHGHTGGGIGEIWRGAAMGLMHDKVPNHYREFMDNRAWFYDLSRRYDGSFGIIGGGRYDDPASWAVGMALSYTMPRKTLRISGAPPTQFSKQFALPERPWGNAADEVFFSIEASETPNGTTLNLSEERLDKHSAKSFFAWVDAGDMELGELARYVHHPDIGIRAKAASALLDVTGNTDGVLSLLSSSDPRARAATIRSLKELDDSVTDRLLEIINDPEESLWVTLRALEKLSMASTEKLIPHLDRLTYFLQHDDWWLRKAALNGMAAIATDTRYYKQILPMITAMQASNTRAALIWDFPVVSKKLTESEPDMLAFALESFGDAYLNGPKGIYTFSGLPVPNSESTLMRGMAWNMTRMPGGYDKLYDVAKQRYPNQNLPHRELFFDADRASFSEELQAGIRQTILHEMIPGFLARIPKGSRETQRVTLLDERDRKPFKSGFYYRRPRMEDWVALYQQAGVDDYNWTDFGPAPVKIAWYYHTFDPKDGKLFGGTRYRDVSYPTGMEKWHAIDFDPESVGWQKGFAPFGQKDGKLVTKSHTCQYDFCRCGLPMQTLWDKEVILLQTRMKVPEIKEGHRYRMLVGGMSHVNRGEGYRIYLNGKQIAERNRGVGKREGALPICVELDQAWVDELAKGDVVIAATSFLKHNFKSKETEQHFSIWFQEMKVPPLGPETMLESVRGSPLQTAAWQALQDPEGPEVEPGEELFQLGDTLTPNPEVIGTWTRLGTVNTVEEFEPGMKLKEGKLPETLTFSEDGHSNDPLFFHTDNKILDLRYNEALGFTRKDIGGETYLFVENGGFDAGNGPDWKPKLCVMKMTTEE